MGMKVSVDLGVQGTFLVVSELARTIEQTPETRWFSSGSARGKPRLVVQQLVTDLIAYS